MRQSVSKYDTKDTTNHSNSVVAQDFFKWKRGQCVCANAKFNT